MSEDVKTKKTESGGAGIKTREKVKDVKVLNKSSVLAERTREAMVRTKNKAENLLDENQDSATNYAEDRIKEYSRDIAYEGGREVKRQGKKAKDKVEEKIRNQVEKRLDQRSSQQTKANAQKAASKQNAASAKTNGVKSSIRGKNASIKTTGNNAKAIKTTAKSTGKASIKTAEHTVKGVDRTIKTAERTAKTAVKTAERTAEVARKTAETAAKASEKAVVMAEKAAVAAEKAAVAAGKAIIVAVKAAAAAVAKAVSAIGAAIVAAAPIIILALLLMAISVLLTGDSRKNTDDDMTNAQIIQSINTEWQWQLDVIGGTPYDSLAMEGSRASWVDIFAVFTAKAAEATESEWSRRDEVNIVFWDMHSVSYKIEIIKVGKVIGEADQRILMKTGDVSFRYEKNGVASRIENVTYQNDTPMKELFESLEDSTIKTKMTVTVHTKTIDEMADLYEFSDWQRQEAKALTGDDFKDYWMERLYGVYGANDDIVNVALTQLGNTGGWPYWEYCGFPSRVEWCACFVSWCAGQCGYVDQGLIPNTGSPPYQVQFFRGEGHWLDGSATPAPGMIIFFDWYNADFADHVGIVEKVEGGYVYTIEGNSSDSVRQKQWAIGDSRIMGYGWIIE